MSAAVDVHVPDEGQRPDSLNFHYGLEAQTYGRELERDGSYILRTNAIPSNATPPGAAHARAAHVDVTVSDATTADTTTSAAPRATGGGSGVTTANVISSSAKQADPAKPDAAAIWSMYMQLVQIESAFKSMKSDLAIRPVFHQVQQRVKAHLFVAFMGYSLMAALRKHLGPAAPGLSPRAVLEQLAAIQMVDVCLPTSDGRWLVMPRYTEPESEQRMLLEKMGLSLPSQPPPRIRSGKLLMCEPTSESD